MNLFKLKITKNLIERKISTKFYMLEGFDHEKDLVAIHINDINSFIYFTIISLLLT